MSRFVAGSQLTEALGELMMGFEMSRLLLLSPECRMSCICWQEGWLVLYRYVFQHLSSWALSMHVLRDYSLLLVFFAFLSFHVFTSEGFKSFFTSFPFTFLADTSARTLSKLTQRPIIDHDDGG